MDLNTSLYVVGSKEYLTDDGARLARRVPKGSVLVSCIGKIGKVAIAGVDLAVNQQINCLVPGPRVVSEYLYYAMRFEQGNLQDQASNTIVPILNKSRFAAVGIPLPPLADQQRIVAKLDEQMAALDRAEQALGEQQAAASVLTAATLQQIFSGCGSKRWRTLPIGDLCQASISTWDTSARPQEQKRYIEIAGIDPMSKTIGNTRFVQACTAPSRARNVVHTGDIIIATTRPNLNAVAVVPPDLDNQVCSTGFAVLRPNELVISRWLYWSVRSPDFIRTVSDLVVGAMYPAVTDKQVMSVVIPVPPIPEQECLVARLDQQTVHLGLVLRALEDQEAELAALQSTLLDAAFSRDI